MQLEPQKLRKKAPKSETELELTWIVKCGFQLLARNVVMTTCIHMMIMSIIPHSLSSHFSYYPILHGSGYTYGGIGYTVAGKKRLIRTEKYHTTYME